MNQLRIVFMGTPEFATGILDNILNAGYNVVGVITAPDKPAGRGQKLKVSSVKEYALSKNLKILQPLNLKDEGFLEELRSLKANLQVVVAFRMLPDVVWKMPQYGTFNLHASLLPDYRGAAPINWAIINGESKTGVTTFFIDEKIDTGAIILSKEVNIMPDEDAGQLHDKLMEAGKTAVLETLTRIESGNVTTQSQHENPHLKTAHKLNKENCKIDWTKSGKEIHDHVRGLSPYPSAWCVIRDNGEEWNVKIFKVQFEPEDHNQPLGKILTGKRSFKVAINDGFVEVLQLQFPGKKKMETAEFLNGMSFTPNAYAG